MTNKFDLKKYLTEHKATQASILREGFEEKLNERPITEEEKENGNLNDYENRKEYNNWSDFIKGIKTEYPDITNKNLIVKDSPKFPGQKLYNFDDPFGPNRLIAIWNEKAGTGIVKPNTPEKESPYISPDPKNLPKGMYGESKEALKAKIKEMIIAELSLAEGNAPINMVTTMDGKTVVGTHQYGVGFKSNEAGQKMGFKDNPTSIPNGTKMSKGMDMNEDTFAPTSEVDPVSENVGEVGEKDYEEYQELKKFLNSLEDTNFKSSISSELSKRNSDGPDEDYYEKEGNGEIDDYDTEYDLGEGKFKLKEFFIDEAKKDEEEAPAEDAPEDEEVDATLDTTATGEDFNIDTSAVDPNIKAVQDALTQAQAAAKNINDEKLTTQISNTVIMFTRDHVANTKTISEGKSLTDGLTSEEKKIYDKVKNTITYKGMKKYDSKEYSKKLQKALQAAAMHNEESER